MIMAGKRIHIRSYNGKHYRERITAYLLLKLESDKGNNKGLTSLQMCKKSDLNYEYIHTKVSKWAKWKDLNRKLGYTENEQPANFYLIAKSGLKFLESIPQDIIRECLKRIKNETNPQ